MKLKKQIILYCLIMVIEISFNNLFSQDVPQKPSRQSSLEAFSRYSDLELWASPYVKTAYDSTFRLVGDTANGGLPMWRTGHDYRRNHHCCRILPGQRRDRHGWHGQHAGGQLPHTGSSGNFANDASYPGYNQSTVSTNFVLVSTGLIHIPDTGTFPQTWTFGVNSDEGFKLSLMGVSGSNPSSFSGTIDAALRGQRRHEHYSGTNVAQLNGAQRPVTRWPRSRFPLPAITRCGC